MSRVKNLGYWKCAHATMCMLRDAAKQHFQMYAKAAEKARREVESIEGKVLVCVVLLVLVGGCNTLHGVLKDGSWLLKQGAENTEVQEEQK